MAEKLLPEQEDLISLVQLIIADKELGDILRKIISADEKQRAALLDGLTSLLKKKGLNPHLVKALSKLKDADLAAAVRNLL